MPESVPAPAPEEALSPEPGARANQLDRYAEERTLGQGAMGAVYLVRDRETGEQLALKKLFRMDPRSVLRVKREFRSLAGIRHPNLVKVYELGHAPEGWFLAMEYVAGEDLQTYLRVDRVRNTTSRRDAVLSQLAAQREWLDEKLQPAFHQLASGVQALHRAGMLHRDLKPSNVLVANGRVVVLDFGLVRELDPNAAKLTEEGAVSGTPAYMAPEQATGKPLSEATDWYAFGAMLYEALTGELPFDGPIWQLMNDKLTRDPVPPQQLYPDLPAGLCELCMALLAREPSARPAGSDVLRRLEPLQSVQVPLTQTTDELSLQTETQLLSAPAFFGREHELSQLLLALQETEAGRSVVVHVRGISGAGKSALVEHFLDELEQPASGAEPETLVLRSRCYEREAMPFKALDGVMDALSRHLSRLDDFEVSHLLPAEIAALSRLFPVLERLHAVQHLLARRGPAGDAVQDRQRAEAALRDFFVRMTARRPVVIWIDDLQWGDLDSAHILKGWLQRAIEQPLLLVLSYRADEVETSECLRFLLNAPHQDGAAASKIVQVSALAADNLAHLCREQLGPRARGHEALIACIVREADGSPFLAAQLTALADAKLVRGDRELSGVSIGDLVAQNSALLPPGAQHLLSVLAVAGRPIAPKLALRAAGIRRGGSDLVHALRRRLLVRTREVAGERLLEMYHDRVRESVYASLGASTSEQLHASLLSALEFSGRADPDWLHLHALGALQRVPALRYGLIAAERAMVALAFEHAAELYTRCVELNEAAEQRAGLHKKLADALGCCGRGSRAADAYLAAAELATGAVEVALVRSATSHLLRSGRFAEGERMMGRCMGLMGIRTPQSPLGMILALLWEQLRLRIRGLRWRARNEAEIPSALLARIDDLRSLRTDMQTLDPIRAGLFCLRGLRLSLQVGEPTRVLDGLIALCTLVSLRGTARAARRTDQLLVQVSALANKLGTVRARAQLCTAQVIADAMLGRAEKVLPPSSEAQRLWRELRAEHSEDSYHFRFIVTSTRISMLYVLGDYKAFRNELNAALEEARASENVAAVLHLADNETLLDELCDRGEQAVARLEAQRAQLPARYSMYHAMHMTAVMHAACSTRRYTWGNAALQAEWPRYQRSTAARIQVLGASAGASRLALLLDLHVTGDRGPNTELAEIGTEFAALSRRYSQAALFLDPLSARLAHITGNTPHAIELFRKLAETSTQLGNAERARYALGTLLGGSEGRSLCSQAEQRLSDAGVVNPTNFIRPHFPELFLSR